ncbi:ribosomal protein L7/L12, putative [Trypanosoma equiperdum]|nr:ribosomal protein L7/L12, putative [Trypanosoma equiperdum]
MRRFHSILFPMRGVSGNLRVTNGIPCVCRSFSIGVPSGVTPRGTALMPLRESAETVEAIADAYVNMDLQTMRKFHDLVSNSMPWPPGTAPVSCEEMMLQGLAPGTCGGGRVVGATPTVPDAADGSAGNGSTADATVVKKVVEKATVDVSLKGYPAGSKVKLIKELRAVTGLALQEAKAAVERCPGMVATALPRGDAEKLKVLLEGHGAEVELL